MSDVAFYYIAFFLTIGSFLLGFVVSWNLKVIFDTWRESAEYAAIVMHPEMMTADGGQVDPTELIYLRITDEDATLDDEDE